jgi:hypothetical protein
MIKCCVGVLTTTENMGMDESNKMLTLQSYVQILSHILKYMSLSQVKFDVSSTSSFPTNETVASAVELQSCKLLGFIPSGRP